MALLDSSSQDGNLVHWIFAAILSAFSGLFLVVGHFLKTQMDGNSIKHQKHFEHAANMSLHETDRDRAAMERDRQAIAQELIRHTEMDDKRFDRLDAKLTGIQGDIKDILKELRTR